jgi:predicted CDP-diglyceride synthetase/phosphatidate cytidylyltransferase
VGLLRRVRARGVAAGVSPQDLVQGLMKGFAGLMLARMVGYLTFLGAVAATRALEPVSVCVGLVCGTVVFQALEVAYVRKLT